MKRAARLLAAALLLTLCAGPWTQAGAAGPLLPAPLAEDGSAPTPAPAADTGPRPCATAEELLAVLAADDGGVVEVSADLVVAKHCKVTVTQPVTVRMGPHSIYVEQGGGLTLNGPVRLEGEAGPLLRIAGTLRTGPGVVISAAGPGAVAVQVDRAPLDEGFTGRWISELTQAEAAGAGAAALQVTGEGAFELTEARLTARGEGAAGVRSQVPVRLFLCSVSGQDASVEGPAQGVELEGCRVHPGPAGARVTVREAVPGRLAQEGYSVRTGAAFTARSTVEYWLRDPEGSRALGRTFAVEWSGLPADLSAPGEYTARCTPVGLPDWYPVPPPAFDVPVHVVDPDTPHLKSASRLGRDVVILTYLRDIWDAEAITLWYRPAGEAVWRDIMDIPESGVNEIGAHVGRLEPNRDYLFRLEVEGGPMEGISAEFPFRYYDDDADRVGSGDRDDGDRGDQGENPPNGEIIPPPEESTGDGGQWEEGPSPAPAPTTELEPEPAPPAPSPSGEPATPPPAPAPEGAAVSLTAEELADQLLANPVQVTLVGEGIKAALPTALLEDVELGAGESFSAALAFTPGRFSVAFWAGERPLEDFGGPFTVEVAWAGETAPRCRRPGEPPVEADRYGDGRAVFTLNAPGTYTILEEPVPAGPVTETPPAVTGAPFTSPAAGTAPPAGGSAAPGAAPAAQTNAAESARPTSGPGGPSPAPGPETMSAAPSPEQTARGDAEEEAERSSAVPVLAALGLCGLGGFAAWRWRRGRGR